MIYNWRYAGISLAAMLLLIFILYRQTLLYLAGIWNQLEVGEYAHGYLVLLISAYLIFINRVRLSALTPCPEYRAIIAVALASTLWLAAALVDIEVLQSASLLLLVMSVVWALLGTAAGRILLFPVLYISFAIPVWFPLSPLLQNLTADTVFWLIRILEVPALREANDIILPAGKMSIAEACSGLRYMLAALTLGTLYAYLNYVTLYSRLLVVLVSVTAAVLANILRVLIVVYLAYSTDMQHPLVDDHLMLGWYLFASLVIGLLVFDALIHRIYVQDSPPVRESVAAEQVPCNKGSLQLVTVVMAAALVTGMAPGLVFWLDNQPIAGSRAVQIKLPAGVTNWTVVDVVDDWLPAYHGAITQKLSFSDKNNHIVHLYVGLYATQKQDEELINELNKISDNQRWHRKYPKARRYKLGDQYVLEQMLENKAGRQRLVWYWYRVAGQNTVSKYQAKALQLLTYLRHERQASVIAIAMDLQYEQDIRKLLHQFKSDIGPAVEQITDN